MRITKMGQVTIPQEICIQFGLISGTEIEFEIVNDMIILKKLSGHRNAADLIARMSGKATIKITTDEIIDLTR